MKIIKRFTALATIVIVCAVILSVPVIGQENPKLSDEEVASVAVVANQIDISYAEIAKERSKDAEVLAFAKTMATDHQGVIDQATALAKKLGITPKDNAVSKNLLADAEKTKKTLRSK